MVMTLERPRARRQQVEATRKEIVLPELERLRAQNTDGLLIAEEVVQAAADEHSPLHRYFQWDDTEAAHQYRLVQARQLISAMVTIIPNVNRPVLAYVSLRSDRQYPSGGYRALVDVLSDEQLRGKLLAQALDEYGYWERKYRRLEQLVPIFQAAKEVRRGKDKSG